MYIILNCLEAHGINTVIICKNILVLVYRNPLRMFSQMRYNF